jgi:hypothetical protein
MSTTTASVANVPTIASRTDALILQHYAEIARCAVQLAITKLSAVVAEDRTLQAACNVCQNVSELHQRIRHDESCLVGRVFAIAAEIATLQSSASDRLIEYFSASTPLGEFRPGRTVTHEQATRSSEGAAA